MRAHLVTFSAGPILDSLHVVESYFHALYNMVLKWCVWPHPLMVSWISNLFWLMACGQW